MFVFNPSQTFTLNDEAGGSMLVSLYKTFMDPYPERVALFLK